MTQQMALHFFPQATTGLRDLAPRMFEYLFPDWVAEKCPMPRMNIQTPSGESVTLRWPLTAAVILAGLLTCWLLGTRLLVRALRNGAQARQGLFIWSCAVLSYGFMCLGGFFFHCFHIRPLFHMMDVAATGLSSLSIMAGFASFSGMLDDRTTSQRLTLTLCAIAFVILDLYCPSFVQEQLYALPAFGAAAAGGLFLAMSQKRIGSAQREAQTEAQLWLVLGGVGVVVGVAALPLDKYLCVYLGAEFSLLFWFFLGCNFAIFCCYKFVCVVADKNLYYTDVKMQ